MILVMRGLRFEAQGRKSRINLEMLLVKKKASAYTFTSRESNIFESIKFYSCLQANKERKNVAKLCTFTFTSFFNVHAENLRQTCFDRFRYCQATAIKLEVVLAQNLL